ncbi:MAG: hypothetical protein FJ357_05180 [Thaumarchaeota archaeon]|nr:hypothetical protein [Nitrososphaerota archaeon]
MAITNFIDMCAVCKQGVAREYMVYQRGRVFHERCFETHGNLFPVIDQELAQLSAKTRVELVQMKNLKARTDAELISAKPKAARKKTSKPKKKTKNVKKSKPKAKSKKRASKKRR